MSSQMPLIDDWTNAQPVKAKTSPKKKRKRATEPDFIPNHYQQAVLDWVVNGHGNAVVRARAGTGKSSTIIKAAWQIPRKPTEPKILFLAFNTAIREELKAKLPSRMNASTLHSRGRYILQYTRAGERVTPVESKYLDIGSKLSRRLVQLEVVGPSAILALFQSFRDTLCPLDREAVSALAASKGIYIDESAIVDDGLDGLGAVVKSLEALCQFGVEQYREEGVVDFTDMLWLPCFLDLRATTVDWVFIDEAQDLSSAGLDLALRCGHEDTRYVFVGDEAQAIYAFAGANSDSLDRIESLTNPVSLPLSICYRCGTNILDYARWLVPDIENSPTASEGEIKSISESQALIEVAPDDIVLSRRRVAGIEFCLALGLSGKKAYFKGVDIAKGLTALIARIAKQRDFCYQEFPDFAKAHMAATEARWRDRGVKNIATKLKALEDDIESCIACYSKIPAHSAQDLVGKIRDLFSETGVEGGICVSTIHKAKGLEAERVYILEPGKLPLTWEDQTREEYQQELNLAYVAVTRAKSRLVAVEGNLFHLRCSPEMLGTLPSVKPFDCRDASEVIDAEIIDLPELPPADEQPQPQPRFPIPTQAPTPKMLSEWPELVEVLVEDIADASTHDECALFFKDLSPEDKALLWGALPVAEKKRLAELNRAASEAA